MENCIKEMRKKKHMTQQELAEAAEVSRTTIAMLESRGKNTTTQTLTKIAAALDTTVDALFFSNGV